MAIISVGLQLQRVWGACAAGMMSSVASLGFLLFPRLRSFFVGPDDSAARARCAAGVMRRRRRHRGDAEPCRGDPARWSPDRRWGWV